MSQENRINSKDDKLISDEVKTLLNKIISEKRITDVNISINPGSNNGDNYMGLITKVEVTGNVDSAPVVLNLIAKTAPESEAYRSIIPIRLAYEREIFMYSIVLPEYMSFQLEKNIKSPFTSFAKCLKTSLEDKNETLILEDMKSHGFIMLRRQLPLSYAHVSLVLKELARLHSFSFALKDQKPELMEYFEKKIQVNIMEEVDMEQFDVTGDMYSKLLTVLDPVEDAEAIERYKKYQNTIKNDMKWLISKKEAEQYAVIRHGDCWTNNFLFKYDNKDKSSEPTNMCFLDWQMSYFGSPVLDLLYFLYSCTDKNVRDPHFDQLLVDYYNHLKAFTAELGSDIDKLFPYTIFLQHMKHFGRYGLANATTMVHMMVSEFEELPDIKEAFAKGIEGLDSFPTELKNKDYYNMRMREIILHQIEKEYI